jgi:hypothetical protein
MSAAIYLLGAARELCKPPLLPLALTLVIDLLPRSFHLSVSPGLRLSCRPMAKIFYLNNTAQTDIHMGRIVAVNRLDCCITFSKWSKINLRPNFSRLVTDVTKSRAAH